MVTTGELATDIGLGVGLLASAFWSFLSHRQARQVNDSVNHRHETGTPRIYDLIIDVHRSSTRTEGRVDELIEWKRTYDGSPLSDGVKLRKFLDEVEDIKRNCENNCREENNPHEENGC